MGTAVAAGVAAAGVAIAKFGTDSVKAFVESEQSSLKLDQALAKFPKTSDVTRASLDALNASLATKTRFDDDATASGQAVLAQFGLTGKQITELTPLLQDYAARTGKDIPTAAEDLGKAVMGQGRALKGIGLDLKDTGSATGNLNQLMGGLRTQVGGFAAAEGQTAAGQAEILKNRFGEIQEEVGSKLVPALTSLAGKLLDTINFLDRNREVVIPLTVAVGGLAAGVWAVNTATKVVAATQAAWTAVQSAAAAKTVILSGITKGAAAAQWLLNVALTANPIGLVIVAIAALAAGVVLAYRKSETFRGIVNSLWAALKVAGTWIVDTGKKVGTWVVDKWQSASDKISAFIEKIKGFTLPAWVQKVADLLGKIASAAATGAGSLWSMLPGVGDGPGRAGARQSGGATLSRVRSILPAGASISSTYRSPEHNRAVGGSPTSYHTDRNNPAVDIVGSAAVLDQVHARLAMMGGWRELLWRTKGHWDHVHVAHSGGVVSKSWPQMPGWRADERPARLQVGETVVPKGGLVDGPMDLSDSTINRLAEAMLLGAGAVTRGAMTSQARAVASGRGSR